MQITKHAQQRLSQRAIDMSTVSLALGFGLKIEQNGAPRSTSSVVVRCPED